VEARFPIGKLHNTFMSYSFVHLLPNYKGRSVFGTLHQRSRNTFERLDAEQSGGAGSHLPRRSAQRLSLAPHKRGGLV
jgi:hypothetical protein